jgi:hypothetical protein
MELNIYSSDTSEIRKLNPSEFMNSLAGGMGGSSSSMISMGSFHIWEQMLAGKQGEYINELVKEQYDIVEFLNTKCSEIDQLISIKQQKIVELKDYKKSLIYEYTTGKKEVKL